MRKKTRLNRMRDRYWDRPIYKALEGEIYRRCPYCREDWSVTRSRSEFYCFFWPTPQFENPARVPGILQKIAIDNFRTSPEKCNLTDWSKCPLNPNHEIPKVKRRRKA